MDIAWVLVFCLKKKEDKHNETRQKLRPAGDQPAPAWRHADGTAIHG
jgi:hypothetical protein